MPVEWMTALIADAACPSRSPALNGRVESGSAPWRRVLALARSILHRRARMQTRALRCRCSRARLARTRPEGRSGILTAVQLCSVKARSTDRADGAVRVQPSGTARYADAAPTQLLAWRLRRTGYPIPRPRAVATHASGAPPRRGGPWLRPDDGGNPIPAPSLDDADQRASTVWSEPMAALPRRVNCSKKSKGASWCRRQPRVGCHGGG